MPGGITSGNGDATLPRTSASRRCELEKVGRQGGHIWHDDAPRRVIVDSEVPAYQPVAGRNHEPPWNVRIRGSTFSMSSTSNCHQRTGGSETHRFLLDHGMQFTTRRLARHQAHSASQHIFQAKLHARDPVGRRSSVDADERAKITIGTGFITNIRAEQCAFAHAESHNPFRLALRKRWRRSCAIHPTNPHHLPVLHGPATWGRPPRLPSPRETLRLRQLTSSS